ncbi:VOC family protein [Candidatus Nomurabacteria bacterium]|nr:VOC family protein [Candidatus Nomurabacteria bacterium]
MQKIIPCLWFEKDALEAAKFYASLFPASSVGTPTKYDEASAKVSGMPEGSVLTVPFELAGQKFLALNGGPIFKFTPAVSFFVGCNTEEDINWLYQNLSDGGKVLMEFQKYPFAEKYAWFNDKYGVSWQLMLSPYSQKITPMLMFTGDKYGKAKEAMDYYVSVFKERDKETKIKDVSYYSAGVKDATNKVVHGVFTLGGYDFMAMDSGEDHKFNFTMATSFMIECQNQEDINYFWDKLSMSGKPSQCGWLEDRYGVAWQVVPTILDELLADPDKAKAERTMKAMLNMTKLDIETLKKAYANEI